MAHKKDVCFVQAVYALGQGAGGAHLSSEAAGWLHERYHAWIGNKKKADLDSPETVWETDGKGFLAKFKEIGQKAKDASGGAEISRTTLEKAALDVESTSPCPYCP